MNHSSLFSCLAAKILVSSIFICLAPSLFAQNDNPTGKSGMFNGNSDIGASYDPYTANTTRPVVDLRVPGAVGSYPLQWTRTMNSRRTEGHGFDFGSGAAWQHSYAWGIDFGPRTRAERFAPVPKSYIVYYPDGRRIDFQRRQSTPFDHAWRGPAGTTDRFQPVAGTGTCILLLSDGGQLEFSQVGTFDPELGWEFEMSGPNRIIDPHGRATTLSYSNGRVMRITEPAGRWFQISYTNPFGLEVIGSVRAGYLANTVTQSVTYSYSQFSIGGFNYTTLTGASYSDGTSAAYTYQASNTFPNTGPPLIQTCDDVRHPGPMKKIAYEFIAEPSEANGGIYGEFGVARKWLWPAPSVVSYWLGGHVESRGDGPQRSFHYGPQTNPPGTVAVTSLARIVPQPYLLAKFTDYKSQPKYLGYDPNTYLDYIEDANGNITRFTKTSLTGKILTITHPPDQTGVSSTRRFFYTNPNTAYYLDHVTDELEHTTAYQRDEKQRVKLISYPDGGTEEFTYDPTFGQVLTHKMTSGGTEAFEYDTRGRLLRYRDPYHDPIGKTGKPTAWYQYDTLDRVSAVTDWRGTGPGDLNYTTNYDYNQRGQLTKRTHPIDPVTSARYFVESTYNNDSTLATQTDERGNTTTYVHDDYKRLASVTAPPGFAGDTTHRVTYLHYNRDGSTTIDYRFTTAAVANVTRPSGNTEKTVYDNNFWKSSVIVGTGAETATTRFTYDAAGNLKTIAEPNFQSSDFMRTEYFYDKRNRVINLNSPNWMDRNSLGFTVSWTYDQIGNKKTQLRANDQLITYDQYDPMNRLQVQSVQHDAGVIDRTVMTYDFAGNLRTFTDGRQKQYVYEHDLMNRRTKLTYPLDDTGAAREERYHYNLANNLDSYRNRTGAVQMFQYDNRNRRTRYSWSGGGRSQSTVYDPVGNVTNVTNGVDTVECIYDFRNRKTSETQIAGIGVRWTVGYSYDADSNRLTLTHPAGHYFTNYYNTRNQLQFVDDNLGRVVTYTYDLSGNRTSRTLRNGTTTTYAPDALNRPVSVDHRRGGTSFGRFDYHFDKVSRIDWVKRDLGHRGDVYEYYLDDQLKTAQFDAFQPDVSPGSPANATSLVYDANGNRISQDNKTGFDYTYTANDLNQYNSVSRSTSGTGGSVASPLMPTYDTNGNLATYDGSAYTYDSHNRLTFANKNGALVAVYYDALGRQVLRGHNGQWIYSIWDGWDLIAEYNEQNVLLRSYVHGAGSDEMVVRFNGPGPTIWYHQDAQGNTTHLTDNTGNLIERYKYDPASSGAPSIYNANGLEIAASAFDNRFLYTGRDWIKEVGLYDYRNRFYLPGLGRFLQPDPIGFAGGDANLYRYCRNNPVNSTDPTGLWTFQYGVNFSAQIGPGAFSFGFGIAIDSHGNVGVYGSPFIGGTGLGASLGLTHGSMFSNAETLAGLEGPFAEGTITGGRGPAITGVAFSGEDSTNGKTVVGMGIFKGGGAGLSGAVGVSNTGILNLFNISNLFGSSSSPAVPAPGGTTFVDPSICPECATTERVTVTATSLPEYLSPGVTYFNDGRPFHLGSTGNIINGRAFTVGNFFPGLTSASGGDWQTAGYFPSGGQPGEGSWAGLVSPNSY